MRASLTRLGLLKGYISCSMSQQLRSSAHCAIFLRFMTRRMGYYRIPINQGMMNDLLDVRTRRILRVLCEKACCTVAPTRASSPPRWGCYVPAMGGRGVSRHGWTERDLVLEKIDRMKNTRIALNTRDVVSHTHAPLFAYRSYDIAPPPWW